AVAFGPAPVNLGTASNFAILAESGVSTVPNSAVSGDVGVSPITSSALTGFSLTLDSTGEFWTSAQVNGHLMGATDASPTPGILTTAVMDMEAAYTDAMGRANPDFSELAAGLIGGLLLFPGLYKWTTGVSVATDITLSGGAADTWIFQIAGTLSVGTNIRINLIGGALPKNIIWVVADTVAIGVGAIFEGNILALTNVAVDTKAIDNGCIYSQKNVALQMATVSCDGAIVVTPPPPPTGTTTISTPSSTFTPKCTPTPMPCYSIEFQDLNASIHGDDYLTYILVDTVEG
ncbi:hypothetical protein B0H10DRAFT_1799811, partial [Mycena sp. CBHHK59/15]